MSIADPVIGGRAGRSSMLAAFLISLNTAWVIALGTSQTSGFFLRFHATVAFRLNQALGLRPNDLIGGYCGFFLSVVAITGALFGVFWAVRGLAADSFLLVYGGALAVFGIPPIGWFWLLHRYDWYPIEVAVIIGLAVGYGTVARTRRRSLPLTIIMAPVVLHFVFWGLRYWEYLSVEFRPIPIDLFPPLLGFLAACAWVYTSRRPLGAGQELTA